MQPEGAQPETPPQENAPVTPEIAPEITPEAPKKRSSRKLIAAIVIAVVVIAAIAAFALVYLSSGSIRVNTTTSFVAASQSAEFSASVQTPALTSAGALTWNFGDGSPTVTGGTNSSHAYADPGTYFVYASSSLSNGRVADNSMSLFPMQVGPAPIANPNPLGEIRAQGAITINKTLSSPGAPTIQPGGNIAFIGAPQQPPTYFFSTNTSTSWTPTSTAEWTNYTWSVTSVSFDFGDGSAAQTNASADPFHVTHTYASAGLYRVKLTVTSTNETTVTDCPDLNCSAATQTGPTPTASAACGAQCQTTTLAGQTVAVGSYALVTYSGSVVNPGTIVSDEAVTGAYTSLDPATDYESTGFEIVENVYQTLLAYDGTSSNTFVPVIADSMPTYTSDFGNYTFHIRSGLKFSTGNPITPYDVKYSLTRTMLFVAGSPSTPGWIVSQYLLPLNPDGTYNNNYTNVNGAITVDNTANTVSFHLAKPAPLLLFEQIVADPFGCGIVDHTWLESVGPKLEWTPSGFVNYSAYGSIENYQNGWRNGAGGSGPYMIDYVSPPDSVVLKDNPYYTPVGTVYPAPTVKKVVLNYVADDSTRELSLQSGAADVTPNYNPGRINVALNLQSQGLVKIQFAPSLNMFWWWFNFNIQNANTGNNRYGNNLPPDFFVDLNMRKAFFYAFNFDQYINQILGNQKYGANFGQLFNGVLPNGMPGYQNLSYYNRYDMALARYYYNQSSWVKTAGWANFGFTLAINVETADAVNKAAAAAWAQSIESLGAPGKITVTVKPISFEEQIEDSVPGSNPMALYLLGWLPDYPYPTDYTVPMAEPGTALSPYGGTYPAANYFNISYFAGNSNGLDTPNGFSFKQSSNMSRMLSNILDSINSTDINTVIRDSDQAQLEAANLTWAVPAYQQNPIYVYRTWLSGMDLEQSVMYNGGTTLLYQWLNKPTSLTAASVSSSSGYALPLLSLAFATPLATVALVGVGAWPEQESRGRR